MGSSGFMEHASVVIDVFRATKVNDSRERDRDDKESRLSSLRAFSPSFLSVSAVPAVAVDPQNLASCSSRPSSSLPLAPPSFSPLRRSRSEARAPAPVRLFPCPHHLRSSDERVSISQATTTRPARSTLRLRRPTTAEDRRTLTNVRPISTFHLEGSLIVSTADNDYEGFSDFVCSGSTYYESVLEIAPHRTAG